MMINAQEEFITHVEDAPVRCATIAYRLKSIGLVTEVLLPVGYSSRQYAVFFARLNFEYANGHGEQRLFGTIWYEDGTWSNRGEYQGSELWELNVCPVIPDALRGSAK